MRNTASDMRIILKKNKKKIGFDSLLSRFAFTSMRVRVLTRV